MSPCAHVLTLDDLIEPMDAWADTAEHGKLEDAEQVVSDWSSEPDEDNNFAKHAAAAPAAPPQLLPPTLPLAPQLTASEAALDCLRALSGARGADEMKSRVVDFVMARLPLDTLVRAASDGQPQKNTAVVVQRAADFLALELLPALPAQPALAPAAAAAWAELRSCAALLQRGTHAVADAGVAAAARAERLVLQGKVRSAYARMFQRLLRRFLDDGAALAALWGVMGRETDSRIDSVARERRHQLADLVRSLDVLATRRPPSRGGSAGSGLASALAPGFAPALAGSASSGVAIKREPAHCVEQEEASAAASAATPKRRRVELPAAAAPAAAAAAAPGFGYDAQDAAGDWDADVFAWASELDMPAHEHAAHTLFGVLDDMSRSLASHAASAPTHLSGPGFAPPFEPAMPAPVRDVVAGDPSQQQQQEEQQQQEQQQEQQSPWQQPPIAAAAEAVADASLPRAPASAAAVVCEPSECVFKASSGSRALAVFGAAFEVALLSPDTAHALVLEVLPANDDGAPAAAAHVLQRLHGTVPAASSISSDGSSNRSSSASSAGTAESWALAAMAAEEALQLEPGAQLGVLDQARVSWTWTSDGALRLFVAAQADKSSRFGRGASAFALRLRVSTGAGEAEARTAAVAVKSKTNHEWLSQGRRRQALHELGARYLAGLEAQRASWLLRGGSRAEARAALARDTLADLKAKVDALARSL